MIPDRLDVPFKFTWPFELVPKMFTCEEKVGEALKTTLPEPVVPDTVVPRIFATLVLKDPAVVVTSPVKAGN